MDFERNLNVRKNKQIFENLMIFQVNIQINHEKKHLEKTYVFRLRFLLDFGRVWEGFWEGVDTLLACLGPLVAFFLMLVFFIIANRSLGGSWGGL